MSHQRMFDFPADSFAGLQINAMHVVRLQLTVPSDGGRPSVGVFTSDGAGFGKDFETEAEARAFYDEWSARAEDAR